MATAPPASGGTDHDPGAPTAPGFRADTYGEAFAEVYDAWYGQVSDAEGAARFVASRCPTGAVVLELGVGTGRLAGPLLATGLRVVGLDASTTMLRLCAERHPGPGLALVRADMAALPFAPGPRPRARFGAVLIGFNTLFNLATAGDQQDLFHAVAGVLAPDGVLVVEANETSALAGGPDRWVGPGSPATGRPDGVTVVGAVIDRDAQVIVGQHVEVTDQGVRFRPWRLRWAGTGELDRMARTAGLTLAERYAGWDCRPHHPAVADSHISVYVPSPGP